MEESKKAGYVAGGIFFLIGILVLVLGLEQGWSNGKISIIIGAFMTFLGGGGIWKPETIGQIIAHYLDKQAGSQGDSLSQSQQNTKNSLQAMAKRDVNIHYHKGDLPEEKDSDEKKDLIKEINQDLTKEKLSNVLIKCIRLATLTDSKKEKRWLENEAYGFDKDKGKLDNDSIPDYRAINSKVRVSGNQEIPYETLDYPLTLGHPIFQIEGWIDEYEKKSGTGEMILTAPASEGFKKVYRDVFKKPLQQDIPSVIPINEFKKILNGLKLKISKFVNSIE